VDVWFAISGEMFVKLRVGSRAGWDCVDQNNIEINTITIPASVGLLCIKTYANCGVVSKRNKRKWCC
jgi:hypothetical protein